MLTLVKIYLSNLIVSGICSILHCIKTLGLLAHRPRRRRAYWGLSQIIFILREYIHPFYKTDRFIFCFIYKIKHILYDGVVWCLLSCKEVDLIYEFLELIKFQEAFWVFIIYPEGIFRGQHEGVDKLCYVLKLQFSSVYYPVVYITEINHFEEVSPKEFALKAT